MQVCKACHIATVPVCKKTAMTQQLYREQSVCCCSIADALEEAGLCKGPDPQLEVLGLVLAVMAESCLDNSR